MSSVATLIFVVIAQPLPSETTPLSHPSGVIHDHRG